MTLRSLGVAAGNMRVAVVTDSQLSVAHAVLMVASDGQYYVLDNLTDEVLSATAEPLYHPVYAINEHGWWNYGPQVAGTPAGSMVHWRVGSCGPDPYQTLKDGKPFVNEVGGISVRRAPTTECNCHGVFFHGQMDFVAY